MFIYYLLNILLSIIIKFFKLFPSLSLSNLSIKKMIIRCIEFNGDYYSKISPHPFIDYYSFSFAHLYRSSSIH